MAKLSHSGHTSLEGDPGMWKREWPTVFDAANLWFFGLGQLGLKPTPEENRSPKAVEAWARDLNLIDSSNQAPEWIIRSGQDPDWLERQLSDAMDAATLEFGRDDLGESPRRFDLVGSDPAGVLSLASLVRLGANVLATPEPVAPHSEMERGDSGPSRTRFRSESERRSGLKSNSIPV